MNRNRWSTWPEYAVDEIWPAEFAAAGFIQDLTPRLTDKMKSGVVPAVADLFKVGDKTYAIPWILDTKFLFYNKEMLAAAGFENPPKTWDELIEQARTLKEKGIVEYPLIWSWAQAEAIMCDYTPLVYSWGGEILAADGSPKFHESKALEALRWMVRTLEEGLSNPTSTTALEEDVRHIFSRGEAAFALNWTYMYALANDPQESQVAGKVGIAPFPAGPAGAYGISGSMGLAITAPSRHPDEAWLLVEFLTSQENQNKYASESLPIWKDSFEHPEQMNAPMELVQVAKEQFATIKGRPEHVPWYNQFSLKAQVALQQVLLGQKSPEQAMQELAAEVEALRK
ncbi:MAG TPA: extracellular solute-binding protein [Symbiobacteriaceae bacterium]